MGGKSKHYDTFVNAMPGQVQAIYEVTESALRFLDYWNDSDATVEREKLSVQIEAMQRQLDSQGARLNQLARSLAALDNRTRTQRLGEYARLVSVLIRKLENQPASQATREELAFEAQTIASQFLDDPDLWNWTDVETTTSFDDYGKPGHPEVRVLEPTFKVFPALSVYAFALNAWLIALDLLGAGADASLVRHQYGATLRRHRDQLLVRDSWDELSSPPATFAERIRAAITCRPIASNPFAQNRECIFTLMIENELTRQNTVSREVTLVTDRDGDLCTSPPDIGLADERAAEDDNGLAIMSRFAELLTRVERTGSPRSQSVGRFPNWFAAQANVYVVANDGRYQWLQMSLPRDTPQWTIRDGFGVDWSQYINVFPAGVDVYYGLRHDGSFDWLQHVGRLNGEDAWAQRHIDGPGNPGEWFDEGILFGAAYGVMYGRLVRSQGEEGNLKWGRQEGFRDCSNDFGPSRVVGRGGWDTFKFVFSGGDGVIYAGTADGELKWYRHDGHLDGSPRWASAPISLGSGFADAVNGFSIGGGYLFILFAGGRLGGFVHRGWRDGRGQLEGPVDMPGNWADYRLIFASLPAPIPGEGLK